MSEDPKEYVSSDDARLLWKRAAELQAEAARRLEERSRLLAPAETTGSGFRLTEVKSAALEAGISPEFVELAYAEVGSEAGKKPPSEAVERRARQFLGIRRASLEVSRVIDASPAEVFESLQRVLPSARYALLHVNTLGDDPLKDGVFVFEPPSMWTQAGAAAEFAGQMGGVGAKQLFVSLREIGPEKSELSVRAPMARGFRTHYFLGLGLTGSMAVGAGIGGAAIATAAMGALGIAAAPLLAGAVIGGVAVGTGGVGGLSLWGFRALFRHSVEKAETALTTLLQVVDVGARSRGAFPLPGPVEAHSTPFGG